MAPNTNSLWFPLFEFQDYGYESYLVLPTSEQAGKSPGSDIAAKKWAKGNLKTGQAFKGDGAQYTLEGTLSFGEGVDLAVSVAGNLATGHLPATL